MLFRSLTTARRITARRLDPTGAATTSTSKRSAEAAFFSVIQIYVIAAALFKRGGFGLEYILQSYSVSVGQVFCNLF